MTLRKKLNEMVGEIPYVGGILTTPIEDVTAEGIVAVTLAVALASGCSAPAEVKFGYNALETAVTHEEDIKNRAIVNVGANIGEVDVRYHSLNDLINGDGDTYFGRHRWMVGKKGFPVMAELDVKLNRDGVINTKGGIRDFTIIKKLGGYGYIEFLVGDDAGNITAFYGRKLGNGFSLEGLQMVEMPFDGDPWAYNELQLNKNIGKHVALFARGEVKDLEPDEGKGTYMIGVMVKK